MRAGRSELRVGFARAFDGTSQLALLIALAFLLTGCPGGGGGATGGGGPPVPIEVLNAVVAYVVAQRSLRFTARGAAGKLERHKGFFVRRRAARLGQANPTWATEPNQPTLRARILSEFDDVVRYLNAKVGSATSPSAFIRSADTTPHLDLDFAAHILTSTSTTAANAKKASYVQMRRDWVNVIVWRAAAISGDSSGHADAVWVPSADGHTAHLADPVLDELVDRRLRTCERMHHQVSSADALARGAVLTGTSPTGPWTDGFRIRMFEYPRIRVVGGIGRNLPPVIGAANIAEWDVTAPTQSWQWENVRHRRIRWTGSTTRLAAPSAGNWTPSGYQLVLSPPSGVTASNAFATLFTPATDWWGRSWMFCDHVVSALHVEALWLGLKRRTGNDNAFDHLPATVSTNDFVRLGAFVGGITPNALMGGDAHDAWFDNAPIAEADLQVGDQLILWNSFLYPFLLTAEWRLENSIVMDIDSDPATGSLRRDSLQLQGHGIDMRPYARYMREIAGYLAEGLAAVRDALVTHQAAHPADTSFTFGHQGTLVVRWDPYDTFTSLVTHASGPPTRVPGAWWVRVPLDSRMYPTVDAAVNAIPKSVRDDPSPGPGYHHPPPSSGSTVTDAVYFPLFEPANGWRAYFDLRRTGSTAPVQTTLREVQADGTLAPGLFISGVDGTPIAIVRAKVRP
jgi:hypothetical protein